MIQLYKKMYFIKENPYYFFILYLPVLAEYKQSVKYFFSNGSWTVFLVYKDYFPEAELKCEFYSFILLFIHFQLKDAISKQILSVTDFYRNEIFFSFSFTVAFQHLQIQFDSLGSAKGYAPLV